VVRDGTPPHPAMAAVRCAEQLDGDDGSVLLIPIVSTASATHELRLAIPVARSADQRQGLSVAPDSELECNPPPAPRRRTMPERTRGRPPAGRNGSLRQAAK
jgi:hypothetical protein